MEFGLQKNEKMGSPILVGNPRKRIEAKAYRARDRQDQGWFQHDDGTQENLPSSSPTGSPLRAAGGRSRPGCVHCSSVTKQQQLPLHEFQQHIVAAGIPTEHLNRGRSPCKIQSLQPDAAAVRLQQQFYLNCSDWYRHEHTVIADDADDVQKNEKDQCHSPAPTWGHSDEVRGGHAHMKSMCRSTTAHVLEM